MCKFNASIHKITGFSVSLLLAATLALLAGCGGGTTGGGGGTSPGLTPVGGGGATGGGTTTGGPTLQLSAAPTSVKSDNSNTATVTILAVSSTNVMMPGVAITLSADTGLLSAASVTTDATGKATATFSSGTISKANRTATITATSPGINNTMLPVQITGSTVTATATTTSVPAGGASPATMTVTAKDAGGIPISGAAVTFTQAGSGTVTLTPAGGTTDVNGQLAVAVAGVTAGTATVTVSAAGATTTIAFTINPAAAVTFGINGLSLNGAVPFVVPVSPKTTAMQINDILAVQVSAPAPTAKVTFATTVGTWSGASVGTGATGVGSSVLTVTPVAGVATATLTTTKAGVANVQVIDTNNAALSDTLTVGMTAKTAARISLQASPTVVSKTVGTTVGYSNLVAIVSDATGVPVGGAPVAFTIVKGNTNSGENISPVIVFSATTTAGGLPLGAAPTVFSSGSLASGSLGVEIRATVAGTAISTQQIPDPITGLPVNTTASSYDAAIVVGGTAGSVAFGQAAKIIDAGGTSTIYTFPMSVLVADSNGNPAPAGTVVSISTSPIAFTTGSRGLGCDPDKDGQVYGITSGAGVTPVTYGPVPGNGGTFNTEDVNGNLILDTTPTPEDGVRTFFTTGTTTSAGTATTPGYTLTAAGTKDGAITPVNSYGGTIASTNPADAPGTATTDATGLATFNLTYTKSSAIWIIDRIRASATVQGTPAVGQLDWRLVPSQADAGTTCYLPPSPFHF